MIGYGDYNGNPAMVFFFAAIVIVVIIYAIIQSAKKKQLHSDAMLDFTLRTRLEFSPYDILSVINRYSYAKLMQQGHDQEASNLIYGKLKDRDFIFFDYTY